jgi:hypothetical protein
MEQLKEKMIEDGRMLNCWRLVVDGGKIDRVVVAVLAAAVNGRYMAGCLLAG